MFVGSSRESIRAANALANNLGEVAFTKPWPYNFALSEVTIESLIKEAPTFDFAIFISFLLKEMLHRTPSRF